MYRLRQRLNKFNAYGPKLWCTRVMYTMYVFACVWTMNMHAVTSFEIGMMANEHKWDLLPIDTQKPLRLREWNVSYIL